MEKTQTRNKAEKKEHGWDEHIRSMLYAVLLALVFRSFLFEPFHIPSSSMKDGLLIGDYLFVSKYSYGYSRYSFPFGFDVFDGRTSDDRPERGDVVVFRQPKNPRIDFIKRVVGLPGDMIQVRDGVLYVNSEPVQRERVEDFTETIEGQGIVDIRRYRETLPNGRSYTVLDAVQQGEADNTFTFHVPDKHYFMMGDNRDNSADSRFPAEVGFVPEENLVGRAELIFFSVDDGTPLWKIWEWPWALRTDRFFKTIQ